jgi:serine/threonine protein kinase
MQTYTPGEVVKTPKGHFEIEKTLSQGEMAHAYRARDLRSKELVLFKIYCNPVPEVKFCPWYPAYLGMQEDIKGRLSGIPGQALQLRDHFVHQRAYHQVVEWAHGRPLVDLLPDLNKEPTLEKPLLLAKVMLYSLKKVHEQGIIHCDLKPDNYFCEEDPKLALRFRLKMADFDNSLVAGKPSPRGGALAGTFGYFSPEHFRGEMPVPPSDVFTVGGVMLHELLGGVHPFEALIAEATTAVEVNDILIHALKSGRIPALSSTVSPRLSALSPEIGEMIRRCLAWKAEDRPTAGEVHAILLGGRLPRRLVLVGGPAGLKWRLSGAAELSRYMCERYFGAAAGAVSRHQGRFEPSADMMEWTYHPTPGSTNATLVDGRALTGPVTLEAGQTLQIGNPSTGNIGFEIKVEFETLPA